uniref:Uncharacterized protein n=1 Tax=Candidatus Methanogaster sp. ANME-2c ERB4 TaxID=2759911 RepID=A0A7G9YIA8_9EURY|nr:hypothetical protein KOFJCHGD_00007 [Methanosarcinales archaeon ANME-2c ERB4]
MNRVMAKPNEQYTEEERINAANRYQRGERPSKICKSLGGSRVKACENGLEDTTISIKAVRGSGLGMNPEHLIRKTQIHNLRDARMRMRG